MTDVYKVQALQGITVVYTEHLPNYDEAKEAFDEVCMMYDKAEVTLQGPEGRLEIRRYERG